MAAKKKAASDPPPENAYVVAGYFKARNFFLKDKLINTSHYSACNKLK